MATHSSTLAWRIPMDSGAWQATVHGVTKESDMTEDRPTLPYVFLNLRETPAAIFLLTLGGPGTPTGLVSPPWSETLRGASLFTPARRDDSTLLSWSQLSVPEPLSSTLKICPQSDLFHYLHASDLPSVG